MDKKSIITGAIVILVLIILGVLLFGGNGNGDEAPNTEGIADQIDTATFAGEVINVDTSPWAFDGAAVVEVQSDSGEREVVNVPAQINLCEAQDNIMDLSVLQPGDRVVVSGQVLTTGTIEVCASSDHYLELELNREVPLGEEVLGDREILEK